MAQYSYKYKDYPNAPSLTKKSETVGKLTTPLVGLIIGMIPLLILGESHPASMTLTVVTVIAMLIALPIIRNAYFKKLDKKYAQMVEGKIPME